MSALHLRLAHPEPAVALAALCRLAYARHLVYAQAGNASCRFGAGFLCTPTGCCLGAVTPGDLVAVGRDWMPLLPGQRATSEWRLHAHVLAALPGAAAVLHTHSPSATALAVLQRPLRVTTPEITHFLGVVPCVPFAEPGGDALGQGVAAAIREGARAALLARHGVVTWGASVREALYQAELLEAACALDLAVGGLGR